MEETLTYHAGTVVERASVPCLVLGVFRSEVLIERQVRACYEVSFKNLLTNEITSVVLQESLAQADVGE